MPLKGDENLERNYVIQSYRRELALAYAQTWSFKRNPRYYDFSDIGGDCTNFISQCLYAANPIMNHTPDVGWYYYSANKRSASWTGVSFLYRFLANNKGPGPFATLCKLHELQAGDLIQFGNENRGWHHSLIVIQPGQSYEDTFIATHTNDAYNRQLSTYQFSMIRYMHIEGFRTT